MVLNEAITAMSDANRCCEVMESARQSIFFALNEMLFSIFFSQYFVCIYQSGLGILCKALLNFEFDGVSLPARKQCI